MPARGRQAEPGTVNDKPGSEQQVILAADIVGSTALYESLGDSDARALVARCLDTVQACCAEHGGTVIAEVGDQVVACFDSPREAATAASETHAELSELQGARTGPPVRMRIGLHYGPVPSTGDRLLCETVKIANWACGNAKPEQTLATRALHEQLPRIFRAVSRYVDDETWNFISLEHVQLYELIWDVEAITAYAGESARRDEQVYQRVEFEFGGHRVMLDTARPVISIGRAPDNDLVLKSDLVSRQHMSAQFSRGRCTVTDNSTNGSVVVQDDGSRYELKRDSLRLRGSGIIVPGNPDGEEARFAVRFRCV